MANNSQVLKRDDIRFTELDKAFKEKMREQAESIGSASSGKLYDIIYGDLNGRRTMGELKNLVAQPSNRRLVFPSDLEDVDHWVAFSISKRWNWMQDELENSASKKDILTTIFLPVPYNLQTGYDSKWNSAEIGPIGMHAANVVGSLNHDVRAVFTGDMTVGRGVSNVVDGILKAIDPATSLATVANIAVQMAESELAPAVAAAVGNKMGGSLGALLAGVAGATTQDVLAGVMGAVGIVRNPHQAMLFGGVDFRTHNFQYKFVPKSREEADTIREIIGRFKYHMSPGYTAAGQFFEYPETFDIDFKYERHLFNIGNSVLTRFDVNYHAENEPVYHSDIDGNKTPYAISVNMTFVETTITTKESILQHAR